MKVEVLRTYIDRNTKEVVKKGTIIEDMPEERYDEIVNATGYLRKMEETSDSTAEKQNLKTTREANLEEMTVTELKELAKQKEIHNYSKMSKEELIAVLNK